MNLDSSERRFTIRAPFANFAVALVTFVTFCIGLTRLDANSIWLDEAYSLSYAGADHTTFWMSIRTSDGPMALYYIILRAWVHVFSVNAASGRLLSLIAATAAIPVTYLLGRRMYSISVGALAAMLLALNSSWWLRAEDLRVYSISLLVTTCASLFFVKALDRETFEPKIAVLGGILNGLSFILQFVVAGLAIIAQILSLVFFRFSSSLLRNVYVFFAITGVFVAAACIVFLRLGSATSAADAALPPEIWFNISQLTGRLIAFVGLAVASGIAIAYGIRRKERLVAVAVVWFVSPLVVAAITLLLAHEPVFLDRYLISALVPFLLLASYGVVNASPSIVAVPLIALIIFGEVYGALKNDNRSREDWRVAARVLVDRVKPGDVVVAYPREAVVALVEQMRLTHDTFPADVQVLPSDSQNRWWIRPEDLDQFLNAGFAGKKVVWVVVRRPELWPPKDGFKQLLDPNVYYVKERVKPFGLLILEYVHR